MNDQRETVWRRLVSQGWMANTVVTVIFFAVTQKSVLGIILGVAAMIVLLITTARFRAQIEGAPKASPLFKAATRIGVTFAALCVSTSLYVSVRPILIAELPKDVLDIVIAEAVTHQPGGRTTIELPEFQDREQGNSIFAYKERNHYQVFSAKALAEQLFGDGLSGIDYAMKFIVVVLFLWFLGALLIGWVAEQFWHVEVKPGE
jgi:hypothetical protein